MPERPAFYLSALIFVLLLAIGPATAQGTDSQRLHGTLVVAVPVKEGLVACSDKRLYNSDAGTFTDSFVKIRKASDNALFVATNIVGFYDQNTKTVAFDATDITAKYVATHNIADGRPFWDGLKKEIGDQLRHYLAQRKFADWPESEKENGNLLFNLVFYTVAPNNIRSYTIKVYYEKAETPVIYISDPVGEQVRTPKLSGKGRELMRYLPLDPVLSQDPGILRFDESRFDAQKTSVNDAVDFARKLFVFTNAEVPQAQVSATYDCTLLSYQNGFEWLDRSGGPGVDPVTKTLK
jgi:hypothetical protein